MSNHPKIFRDNSGQHFDPYFTREKRDREAHLRGEERKIRQTMADKRKAKVHHLTVHEIQSLSTASRNVPITLAPIKWGKEP